MSFGINIPTDNIRRRIKSNQFESIDEVNSAVDDCIQEIESQRENLINAFLLVKDCNHEFGKSTYTIQRRLIGFVTVYERKCLLCGYEESRQLKENESPPEWGVDANQTYYNNNI